MILEGVRDVHHFKPFWILEPFALEFAFPVALIISPPRFREDEARGFPSIGVRRGESFADVSLGLFPQPGVGGLRQPFRLVLALIAESAFPASLRSGLGRRKVVPLAYALRLSLSGGHARRRFRDFRARLDVAPRFRSEAHADLFRRRSASCETDARRLEDARRLLVRPSARLKPCGRRVKV
jgi:hypothetical protein